MPENFNINFDDLEEGAQKFCLVHNKTYFGKSCPECDEQQKYENPDTKNHPANCECKRCKENQWFDNNTPC